MQPASLATPQTTWVASIREMTVVKKTRFDRSHFKEFGDFALIYETVFYMTEPAYALFMDTQQAINEAIMDRFEKEGIEFAYPTQLLYTAEAASAEVKSA